MEVCVPEEAAVVNDTGTVSSGGAVANLGVGGGEAGSAVGVGEVVPALNHGIDRTRSGG